MKPPCSAEFRCVGAVKVSGPTRGSVPSSGTSRGGRGSAPSSAAVWAEPGKENPARLETITFFKAITFSHNTRAAGNGGAADPHPCFPTPALERGTAGNCGPALWNNFTVSGCAFPGVCGMLHLPEKKKKKHIYVSWKLFFVSQILNTQRRQGRATH